MDHQLALQFSTGEESDFDSLIEVESKLTTTLEPHHIVDGHDFGQGEMNIFIFTDYPEFAFKTALNSIPDEMKKRLKAGCRRIGEEDYRLLYPEDSEEVFRIR